jgi:hypothetical protein
MGTIYRAPSNGKRRRANREIGVPRRNKKNAGKMPALQEMLGGWRTGSQASSPGTACCAHTEARLNAFWRYRFEGSDGAPKWQSNNAETFHGFGNRMNRAGKQRPGYIRFRPAQLPRKKATKGNGYENSFAGRFVEFLARIACSVALSRL